MPLESTCSAGRKAERETLVMRRFDLTALSRVDIKAQWRKQMDTTQRAGQAANCPLCGELPDELIVRTGRDESFPAAFNKLVLVGGDDFTSWGDSSQDYRCPNCGAKFVCENHTSFTGSGINDDAWIIRVPPKAPARQQVNSPSDDHAAAAAKRAAEVEAAQARQAFSIMEKHFASAGAVMKYVGRQAFLRSRM